MQNYNKVADRLNNNLDIRLRVLQRPLRSELQQGLEVSQCFWEFDIPKQFQFVNPRVAAIVLHGGNRGYTSKRVKNESLFQINQGDLLICVFLTWIRVRIGDEIQNNVD